MVIAHAEANVHLHRTLDNIRQMGTPLLQHPLYPSPAIIEPQPHPPTSTRHRPPSYTPNDPSPTLQPQRCSPHPPTPTPSSPPSRARRRWRSTLTLTLTLTITLTLTRCAYNPQGFSYGPNPNPNPNPDPNPNPNPNQETEAELARVRLTLARTSEEVQEGREAVCDIL